VFDVRPFQRIAAAPLLLSLLAWSAGPAPQVAEDPGWPREIVIPEATVIMYQPQPETFEGTELTGRAAVSVTLTDSTEPVFGVVWMTARVDTDRDARVVTIADLDVDRMRFPDATDDQERFLGNLLEAQIPRWDLALSLDRLLTALDLAERERVSAADLRAEPPEVSFVSEPTILVSIDGEPRLQQVEGSDIMRVLNTPFTLLQSSGRYYLNASEDSWYTAPSMEGPWELTQDVPRAVATLAPEAPEDAQAETDEAEEPTEPGPPPGIRVVTEPTELIVTQGAPEYAPITGTDLLYMSNTESDVVLEVGSQRHYVILSGRWFAAGSLSGPWDHVRPEDLPATFASIPSASEMGHLLISVPGTDEANDAVMDHQIPQTTAVRRDQATLDVSYDGEPRFEAIEESTLEYAVNTSYSVIKAGSMYYACHEGVWFVAGSPQGPWQLAESVPDDVYAMPPSSPVYNTKYVYVYDTTPDVVYVGYYPGYMHSYVYGGTIVYGTGYYYAPWYGSYYYPRHTTWGWHVRYNPWYGWSYGFSYSTGPFVFSIGWGGGHGGYWGPVGYRGYHAGYHRGWHDGYRAGFKAGTRMANRQNNIYDRPQNRSRNLDRAATPGGRLSGVASGQQNNVFADRDGNIHRRSENGWQTRSGGDWQDLGSRAGAGAGRSGAAERASNAGQLQRQLDRERQVRQRGSSRTQNFQRSRPTGGRARGGRIRG